MKKNNYLLEFRIKATEEEMQDALASTIDNLGPLHQGNDYLIQTGEPEIITENWIDAGKMIKELHGLFTYSNNNSLTENDLKANGHIRWAINWLQEKIKN